jgi:hypothetical protein
MRALKKEMMIREINCYRILERQQETLKAFEKKREITHGFFFFAFDIIILILNFIKED